MAFAFTAIGTHPTGFLAIEGSSGEVPVDADFVMAWLPFRFA